MTGSYLVCYGNANLRKWYAAASIAVNLGVLGYFKYWSRLPIGFSFITFQQISLLVDTLRADRIEAYKGLVSRSFSRHALNVIFFVAFFPKVIAGPIVKAHDFIPQITRKKLRDIDWEYTFKSLILGYFLKMVIADNLKDYTFWITFPYFKSLSSVHLLFLTFGYSVQLFADFAGYSLIAIGVASLLGYRLPQNFNFPYISKSFSEFWTRWHISLSSFLKEYLYIPLGGNRKGRFRTYSNLIAVMFLGGLWHGATLNFAIWGLCHGVFLSIERIFRNIITLPDNTLLNTVRRIAVFMCVNFAWLIFYLTDFSYTVQYVRALFENTGFPSKETDIIGILIYSLPIILLHLYYLYKHDQPMSRLVKLEFVGYGIMLFLIITNSGTSTTFLYFQF